MMTLNGVTHRHPEIISGVPVFVGTRAPVRSLFYYLRAAEMCGIFLFLRGFLWNWPRRPASDHRSCGEAILSSQ
jgi:hypothetical protein